MVTDLVTGATPVCSDRRPVEPGPPATGDTRTGERRRVNVGQKVGKEWHAYFLVGQDELKKRVWPFISEKLGR